MAASWIQVVKENKEVWQQSENPFASSHSVFLSFLYTAY
jgi:hypothetical protein